MFVLLWLTASWGSGFHQSPSQSAADPTPGKLTAAEDIQAGRKGITLTEGFLVPMSLGFTPFPTEGVMLLMVLEPGFKIVEQRGRQIQGTLSQKGWQAGSQELSS